MKNIIVCPDLYQGSSLDIITRQVVRAISTMAIDAVIIPFIQDKIKLLDGSLDDPDVFMKHNIYVLESLRRIIGTQNRILFIDLFQPSLALLHYYIEGKNGFVKYGALFHGATFIPGDLFAAKSWMRPFEKGMIELLDRIYVPSRYAAQFFPVSVKQKIMVSDYGFCTNDYNKNLDLQAKRFDVVIPHRWNWDKGIRFYANLIKAMPETKFIISELGGMSMDRELYGLYNEILLSGNVTVIGKASNITYIDALRQSRVVVAANQQELFGYGVREAIASGCIPVCVNRACYPEFIPLTHLFNDMYEAIWMIKEFALSYPKFYVELQDTSFHDILEDFFYD